MVPTILRRTREHHAFVSVILYVPLRHEQPFRCLPASNINDVKLLFARIFRREGGGEGLIHDLTPPCGKSLITMVRESLIAAQSCVTIITRLMNVTLSTLLTRLRAPSASSTWLPNCPSVQTNKKKKQGKKGSILSETTGQISLQSVLLIRVRLLASSSAQLRKSVLS